MKILVLKYADHQPLYRQSASAARDGVTPDRASIGRRVGQCEALCAQQLAALRRYTASALSGNGYRSRANYVTGGGLMCTSLWWVQCADFNRRARFCLSVVGTLNSAHGPCLTPAASIVRLEASHFSC